jgi:hypothetical protein
MLADLMRRSSLLLFIGLVLAYNVNMRQVSSHDTYASRFVPISILRDGDLILDEFVPETIKQEAGDDFFSTYFFYLRGHFYDSHPPIGPLLALPVYALPSWIGIPARPELVANVFSKLAASMLAALSALAVLAASKRIMRATGTLTPTDRDIDRENRVAIAAALAYGLGTSVWSTASLAMWTHTPAVFGYSVALWALTAGRSGVAGTAAAAAVIARPATTPAVALLGMYLAHRTLQTTKWHDLIRFCAATLVTGLGGVLYNYWLFGNAEGGVPSRMGYWTKELGTTDMFSGSLQAGLAGLTVSPSRGILIFSPVIVIAVVGALKAWKAAAISDTSDAHFGRRDAVLLTRYASIAALAILLTYSKYIVWWGGHGFGPRYLTDAMPFLGVLFPLGLAPLLEKSSHLRMSQVAAIALLSYSIFIQAVGAFCWPSQWTLNDNAPYRFRLWDWRNSEIEMCLHEGPKVDPAARSLLKRLGL